MERIKNMPKRPIIIGMILVVCLILAVTRLHITPGNMTASGDAKTEVAEINEKKDTDSQAKHQSQEVLEDDTSEGAEEIDEKAQEESQPKEEKESKKDNNQTGKTSNSGSSKADSDSEKKEEITCSIVIDVSTLVDGSALESTGNENKQSYVPNNGKILSKTDVTIEKGSSVYDVLKAICKKKQIAMSSSYSATMESYYVEGINHLMEFDGGTGSGWVYFVNGICPNYGASAYEVKDGDTIKWCYTLDYGYDVSGS